VDDGYEYRIVVSPNQVEGRLKAPGSTAVTSYGPVAMENDELRRETIRVLRGWLDRWTAIRAYKSPVRGTFEVLGEYLYRTVFCKEVEAGFLEARRQAAQSGRSLRVDLVFTQAAQDLAEWPWELVYRPDNGGEFLAKTDRLVLSRSLDQQRSPSRPKAPPLQVYCIIAVPSTKAYEKQRTRLKAALKGTMEYSLSIQPEIAERWDLDTVRDRLGQAPHPHIVHFVGVCRRSREDGGVRLEICLDDGKNKPRWVGTGALVDLFARNSSLPAEDRVRLAVLHLGEPSPLEFEVTFERLAPLLIQKGIPAVLAMQYPLTGIYAESFIRHLYEKIAEGKTIEAAVQWARSALYMDWEEDVAFSSPVLYMQSTDSQLLPDADAMPAAAEAGPGGVVSSMSPARSAKDVLLEALARQPRNAATGEVREAVRSSDWPDDPVIVSQRLARRIRESADRPDIAMTYQALVQAVEEHEEGGLLVG